MKEMDGTAHRCTRLLLMRPKRDENIAKRYLYRRTLVIRHLGKESRVRLRAAGCDAGDGDAGRKLRRLCSRLALDDCNGNVRLIEFEMSVKGR